MSTHPIYETTATPAQAPNPPPREAAWENEGGAAAPLPADNRASAYADLLARHEGERQERDDLLVRRMAAVREPS